MQKKADHLLFRAGCLALIFMGIVASQGKPLKMAEAPLGILSLEIAENSSTVQSIISAWTPVLDVAKNNILVDYAFLAAYSLFFFAGIRFVWRKAKGIDRRLPILFVMLAMLPGVLDAIENIFLLQWLQAIPSDEQALAIYYMVVVKFVMAALLVLLCLPMWLINLPAVFRRPKN